MTVGAIALVAVFAIGGRDLPSPARLHAIRPAQKTQVYDIHGEIIGEFFREDRSLVPLDRIPDHLVRAFVAVEDRRFWTHWGVDLAGIARAASQNLVSGRIRQGASTITQQLARNLFLTHEQTVTRKIKEAVLALRIEQAYSKDEILEMYLNQIYFGEGAYGVQAAARNFFGKLVSDLTLGESAMLAGLPRNPRGYSPTRHRERAHHRRDVVLASMEDCGFITREQFEQAAAESVHVVAEPVGVAGNAPHLLEMIRQHLEASYGSEAIYEEGLVVQTTLDLGLQREAERILEEELQRLEKATRAKRTREAYRARVDAGETGRTDYLQGAVLVMDAASGAIRTLIGGRSFSESAYNRAVNAQRQPGSAFKPFVYLAAIEKGFYPSYMVMDSPVVFYETGGREWRPRNYDREYRGPVTLRQALNKSLNVPTVKLQEEISPEAVIRAARSAGITSRLPAYRSIALGTAEVSLLELTTAYGVFANDGIKAEPYYISRITDRAGNVLEESRPRRAEVLPSDSVGLLNNMLSSVMNSGTGAPARAQGFTLPAAGKTGTADDYADAWFLGFTPRIVAGVWVGYDLLKPIGHGMTGTQAALPIWTQVMKRATLGDEPIEFTVPPEMREVTVCTDTGLPAAPDCPEQTSEFFLEGSIPTENCYLHGTFIDLQLRERWENIRGQEDWNQAEEEKRYLAPGQKSNR
jgi:penicillin-binding protein 1A